MQLINTQPLDISRDQINAKMKASYDIATAAAYRENDKRDIDTLASREILAYLKHITMSFPNKINALDIGCGTGRFFHGLKNVRELVGIDISQPMLNAAKNPIHADKMDVQEMYLLCGDYLETNLRKNGFDFIYSIGVFGHPAPINVDTINSFYNHLAPGGRVFFTIANAEDPKYKTMFYRSALRRFIERVFKFLPTTIQDYLNNRWQHFFVTQEELETLFENSHFSHFRTWVMVNRFIGCEAIKK